MHHQEDQSSLVALGANMAGLADATVGLGIAILGGGASVARRLTGTIWRPAAPGDCGHGCSCGCHTIRHHYCCQCVPPCYGCDC